MVLVAGCLQLGCLLWSGTWSPKPAVVLGRSTDPGLTAPRCNGVVERKKTVTQTAESVKMETTAGRDAAADNFQHTQNPHSNE